MFKARPIWDADLVQIKDLRRQAMTTCDCRANVHAVCPPALGTLSILLAIGAVGYLHRVCNKVPHETCDKTSAERLKQGALERDKTYFATMYERILQQTDSLTTAPAGARVLLLSEMAQRDKSNIQFPETLKEVVMQEVVRSTRILVNVSTTFQNSASGEKSKSQHGGGGPPVKSYASRRPRQTG